MDCRRLSCKDRVEALQHEAARLDGANTWAEFRYVTLPGLRQEIGVCVTVTIIQARDGAIAIGEGATALGKGLFRLLIARCSACVQRTPAHW